MLFFQSCVCDFFQDASCNRGLIFLFLVFTVTSSTICNTINSNSNCTIMIIVILYTNHVS